MIRSVRFLAAIIFLLCVRSSAAITVEIQLTWPSICNQPNAALTVYANGGVGPYSYSWSNGATTQLIQDLPPGTYSVTVTDGNGDTASDQFTVVTEMTFDLDELWAPGCPADVADLPSPLYYLFSGYPPFMVQPLSAVPYEAFVLQPSPGYPVIYYGNNLPDPGQPLNFQVTDAAGCTGLVSTVVPQPPVYNTPQVLEVNGSCSGGDNGSFTLFVPSSPGGWSYAIDIQYPNGSFAAPIIWSGASSIVRNGLPPGTYHIISRQDWTLPNSLENVLEYFFTGLGTCNDTLTIDVPDLGYTCGTLSGKVYVDANENCFNLGEPGLPSTVIEIQPGNYYTLTDGSGNYSINLPYDTYTAADQALDFQEHCGVEGTPFTITQVQPNVTRNFADTSLIGLDTEILLGSSAARPGFEMNYGIHVENNTGVLTGNGTVSFTFDPTLIYIDASPSPTSINGNVITWSTSSLMAFAHRHLSVLLQVPPDITLLGTVLQSSASFSLLETEADLSNNTVTHNVTVTGAYDPNDKVVSTSSGVEGTFVINEDEWLDYTIRFQNTGTDTAFFVVITDTLQSTLDPATLQLGASSHPYTVSMHDHGILRFMFANILLPDSNVNEPASHGFVSFRIRPHLPILPGTTIENIANIYFDFNPPVITEPCVLVAAVNTGLSDRSFDEGIKLFPQPTSGLVQIDRPIDGLRSVDVIALDGRIIRTLISTTGQTVFDLTFLNNGRYLLRFNTGEGHSIHKPVQIMR